MLEKEDITIVSYWSAGEVFQKAMDIGFHNWARDMYGAIWIVTNLDQESDEDATGFIKLRDEGGYCAKSIIWTYEPSQEERDRAERYFPGIIQQVIEIEKQ